MVDNSEYVKKIKDKFSLEDIKKYLDSFQDKKVLVIGDTIIDEYCFVEPKGRAMKDPILSVDYLEEEVYAGGILAIANHLSNFVKNISLVTLLGDHNNKKDFIIENLQENITPHFFVKKSSPTIVKKRYINKLRNEKLFKIEYINDSLIDGELENELVKFLEQNLASYDLVIVGDFGHGFINEKLVEVLERNSKYLSVNVQTNSANMGFNFVTKYNNPSFITMDGAEIKIAVADRHGDLPTLVEKLTELKNFKKFLVTLGKEGVAYFNDQKVNHAPALVSKITDVVGAGDAVFSITSLFSILDVDINLLPFIANCVGGVAVNIMGNKRSVTKEEIFKFIEKLYNSAELGEIDNYFNSVNTALNNLDKENISHFADLLLDTYDKGKTIYVFGNGGSAATASHFCGDLVKGVSYGLDRRFRVICLNDNIPALMSIANDVSYDDIFVEQLKNFLNEGDIVVGISGSGNSTNIVKALEYSNIKGAKTVAICGYKGGKIKDIADLSVHVEISDMEVSEDIHNLVIIHVVKRILTNKLNNANVGEEYEKRVLTN